MLSRSLVFGEARTQLTSTKPNSPDGQSFTPGIVLLVIKPLHQQKADETWLFS
jgi:hypothetical protein